MNKRNWMMSAAMAVLVCSSLLTGGQAYAYSSTTANNVIKAGSKYMGTPYVWGSSRSTKSTMDCSEFVMWAMKEGAHINMGKGGARSQYTIGKQKGKVVKYSELKKGDIVFFSTKATMKYAKGSINRIGHVGIYAGNGKVLHTYGPGGVRYSNMASGWWKDHFVTAVRVL
ncbi:C40 family peptidase [Brevibacillus fluminis]|uniref:C40 family peptidase n=1 Tax=Brevibacillus fluminis TaxID=511487 RepID=UPI003F8C1E21